MCCPTLSEKDRPGFRVAVYRFSGVSGEASRREAPEQLESWIAAKGLSLDGEAFFAYYDAPFIPGPIRRNEALLRCRF